MLARLALLAAASLAAACTSLAPSEFHLLVGQGSSEGQIHRGNSPTPAVETNGERQWIAAGWTWHLGARRPTQGTRAYRARLLELLEGAQAGAAPRAPAALSGSPAAAPDAPAAPEPGETHEHPGPAHGDGETPEENPSRTTEVALVSGALATATALALLKRQAIATATIGGATFLRAGLAGLLRRGPPEDNDSSGCPPGGEP